MQEFYRIRESPVGMTKLEALREAQLALLRGDMKIIPAAELDRGVTSDRRSSDTKSFPPNRGTPYAHPYYWAPFFLIGNWLTKVQFPPGGVRLEALLNKKVPGPFGEQSQALQSKLLPFAPEPWFIAPTMNH